MLKVYSKRKPTVNIFIAHHKRCTVLKNESLIPIQVGRSLVKEKLDMLGDDSGNNISSKNPGYCELTAHYWMWKNVEADYYGLCHYRRYFIFSDKKKKEDIFSNVKVDYFNDSVIDNIDVSTDKILKIMSGNRIVLSSFFDVRKDGFSSLYDHYNRSPDHYISDLYTMLDVISDIYPNFLDIAKEYLNGTYFVPCNMFIMDKELFNEYSIWLFKILGECEKRIDTSYYNENALRVYGYLGERLLGIFYFYLKKVKKIRAKKIQRYLIMDTDERYALLPKNKDSVVVVFSTSDYYVPYLQVAIQSLIENTSNGRLYDIYILYGYIKKENQEKILRLIMDRKNVTITFYRITNDILTYKVRCSDAVSHITNETYYRLLVHKIFSQYKKILYLDSDIIIKSDLANLFDTDLKDNLLAACLDFDFIGMYHGYNDQREYTDNVLGISNPNLYFQGGVLLFNIEKIRVFFKDDDLIRVASKMTYRWVDQDVMNLMFQNRVMFLDPRWDVLTDHMWGRIDSIKRGPYKYYNQYLESRKNPFIIHYAGGQKPWNFPDMDFAYEFWRVARGMLVYEEIIFRMPKGDCLNDFATGLIRSGDIVYYMPFHKIFLKSVKKIIDRLVTPFLPKNSTRRMFVSRVYRKTLKTLGIKK